MGNQSCRLIPQLQHSFPGETWPVCWLNFCFTSLIGRREVEENRLGKKLREFIKYRRAKIMCNTDHWTYKYICYISRDEVLEDTFTLL